jgi:hypothetical protein
MHHLAALNVAQDVGIVGLHQLKDLSYRFFSQLCHWFEKS